MSSALKFTPSKTKGSSWNRKKPEQPLWKTQPSKPGLFTSTLKLRRRKIRQKKIRKATATSWCWQMIQVWRWITWGERPVFTPPAMPASRRMTRPITPSFWQISKGSLWKSGRPALSAPWFWWDIKRRSGSREKPKATSLRNRKVSRGLGMIRCFSPVI
ncbi:hypothetical protein SDC9_205737 [bioreactor metagenome]|uniref:Uncharacterized protein n=1 Tax=bioreactor metagenome TaxID=1076179 RepID=A0A645J4H3_9ZZZZ